MFSLTPVTTERRKKRKKKKKEKTENEWQIINLGKISFAVRISEDLMHNVIKADLKTHSKYLKPFPLGTSFPLNKKDV